MDGKQRSLDDQTEDRWSVAICEQLDCVRKSTTKKSQPAVADWLFDCEANALVVDRHQDVAFDFDQLTVSHDLAFLNLTTVRLCVTLAINSYLFASQLGVRLTS